LGYGYRHPWVYYLLGASKEQLAVWHGVETCDTMCGSTGERVYLYPKWYLTPALGWNGVREDLAPLITHADGTREYRVSDHLASLRWRLIGDTTTQTFDYNPWGDIQSGGPASPSDRTFNEQEKDDENGLFDLGVRKYEVETGRFGSVDPLWEVGLGLSAYGYAAANPVRNTDASGLQANPIDGVVKDAKAAYESFRKSAESLLHGLKKAGEGVKECMRTIGLGIGKSIDRITDAIRGGPIQGGAWKDVREANLGGEVHHTPARQVTPYPVSQAPSIWMTTDDHRQTASWGGRTQAVEYRARQAALIRAGSLRDAIQMDIDDIRGKFGGKYDEGIKQMLHAFGFQH